MNYSEGDIVWSKVGEEYYVYKILRIGEGYDMYHVCTYEPFDRIPQASDIPFLKLFIGHAPVSEFEGMILANEAVEAKELDGYIEYLKYTNFYEYLNETGQDAEVVVASANALFHKAYALTDEKKYEEAILLYTEAYTIFPMFYEAIDNCAFVKMDMGRWQEAIADFQLSLSVNPVSVLAEFSIGECYLKMGVYTLAIQQFDKALAIDPEDTLSRDFKAKTLALMNG